MFDKEFFSKHQKVLVGLLNSPLYSFVRKSLWVDDMRHPIVSISPTAYNVKLPDGTHKYVGRSDNFHGEAIRKSYKPLWEAIHSWDMRFANRFMPALNLGFDTYSSQPDETNSNDSYNADIYPTTNYATSGYIQIGNSRLAANDTCAGMIKWNYSTIPSGSTAVSAYQTLYVKSQKLSGTNFTYYSYKVLRDWVESQVTWNNWKTGSAWSGAGPGTNNLDAAAAASGSISVADIGDLGYKTMTMNSTGIAAIQTQMDGGASYGWAYRSWSADDQIWLASSSDATPGFRPKIDITYNPPDEGGPIWFM